MADWEMLLAESQRLEETRNLLERKNQKVS
jgi:hypothetical protein